MFLPRIFVLSSFIFSSARSVIEPHISDFLKTVPDRSQQNVQQGPHSNDSHRGMNYRSLIRRLSDESREEQISWEIELGHTGRKEFVPLMDQRNKHEDRANGALIAGVLLGKEKPLLGQPLKKYAKDQRTKAQENQTRMDAIKSAGHIDPKLQKKDIVDLTHANFKHMGGVFKPLKRKYKRRKYEMQKGNKRTRRV